MRGGGYHWLAGLLCGLMLPLVSVRAQSPADEPPGQSYVEIQPPGNNADIASIMQQRLERLRGMSETEKLLQQFLKDPQSREWIKQFPKQGITQKMLERWKRDFAHGGLANGPIDPQLKSALEKALKDSKLDVGQQRRIENTIKNLPTTPPPGRSNPGSFATPPQFPKHPGKMPPTKPPSSVDGPTKPPPAPSAPSPDASPSVPEPSAGGEGGMSKGFANWLLEQAKNMQKTSLQDSPALHNAIEHLDKYLSGHGAWHPGGGPGSFTERFGKILKQARRKPLFSGSSMPHLPEFKVPSLPRPSLPGVHAPRVHFPGFHAPRIGVTAPGPGSGKALLWLVVIVVGALLLWRLSRMTQPIEWLRSQSQARLGPWPVHPAAVRTRTQLVQAFEYLSILRLGPAARSWNHLQIAAGLGGEADPSRDAADQLAALYEEARYLPGEEALSPVAVQTARRTLTLLAGVAQA